MTYIVTCGAGITVVLNILNKGAFMSDNKKEQVDRLNEQFSAVVGDLTAIKSNDSRVEMLSDLMDLPLSNIDADSILSIIEDMFLRNRSRDTIDAGSDFAVYAVEKGAIKANDIITRLRTGLGEENADADFLVTLENKLIDAEARFHQDKVQAHIDNMHSIIAKIQSCDND